MQTHVLSYCARSFPPASAGTTCLFPQVFEILLSRGYSESNFRDDLKNLYMKLGLENKMMIFLFTDAHVAEEGFLELINNMLTSGTACPVGTHVTGMSLSATAVEDGSNSLWFLRVGIPEPSSSYGCVGCFSRSWDRNSPVIPEPEAMCVSAL